MSGERSVARPPSLAAGRFRAQLRLLIGLAWGIPPVFGLAYLMFAVRMFSPSDMVAMLLTPPLPIYIVATFGAALWFFSRYCRPIEEYLEGGADPAEAIDTARRFPAVFWSTFITYLIFAPPAVWWSAVLATELRPEPVDWFRIWLVSLIVSIIVGLPIFFAVIDLFGKALAGVRLPRAHITIQVKVFLIAALVPLLIDTMIVQYYWTQTGYFTVTTFWVWAGLEGLAVVGALLFVRSFRQSLAPLQGVVTSGPDRDSRPPDELVPSSTDELGVLTIHFRDLLDELGRRSAELELRNRVLTAEREAEDSRDLARALLELIRTATGAVRTGLFELDEVAGEIRSTEIIGPDGLEAAAIRVRLEEESLRGLARHSEAPIPSGDASSTLPANAAAAEAFGCDAALMAPITLGPGRRGVVVAGFSGPLTGDPPISAVEVLAAEGGISLENVRRDEERESLRAQVMHAQRLDGIGRLAGGVAHDFNNILTIIVASCALIDGMDEVADEVRPFLREIEDASRHATELTSQLLAFSKKQVTRPEVLDPNVVITTMGKLLHRLLPERIELKLQLTADAGRIEMDRIQLEQVLLNLVVNARDAIPGVGKITVRSAAIDGPGGTKIEVADTGSGIPDDLQSVMFEPFFTTKGDRGTGLGLATVRAIIEEANGSIEVASGSAGTRVSLLFPPATRVPGTERRVTTHPPVGESLVLMLVDDNPALRRILAGVLRQEGHQVVEAADGEEALGLNSRMSMPLDVLITDVVMPGMSGPELAALMLRDRPDLRVLLISGYADDESLERARKMDLPVLAKPFRPGDLVDLLGAMTVGSERV